MVSVRALPLSVDVSKGKPCWFEFAFSGAGLGEYMEMSFIALFSSFALSALLHFYLF